MKAAAALAPALRDAARMVARVASGRSLADQFSRTEAGDSARAALLDLTHGTLRRYGLVQAIVATLSRRGLPDPLVQGLLWCALYALQSGRYAEYTVVDQGVRACALLERPLPVERLPGFAEGLASVQDAGAQRAAHCLDLRTGQRVLDACAAPGGKSAHILELAEVALTAVDNDAARVARIESGLRRLGLAAAAIRVADAARLEDWWDGVPFDRVLADVPCTASGVARRHPDLKWLRRAGDAAQFAQRQAALLDALWRALAPGGKLLYVTCSVFPRENEAVVDAFVARAAGAARLALPDAGPARLLPSAEHDGFFFALIQRQA